MILVVVGTRPELLKMAPVVRLAKTQGLPVHVHCTMQSPDLVDRGVLEWDTEGPITGFHPANLGTPVRMVVVQGDTTTAFGGAIMGYETGIPVMHVEAGVRTYDLSAPWPEEGYRRMISQIATWHACTTQHNLGNLRSERVGHDRSRPAEFRVTGSPIVESVRERASRHGPIGGPHEQTRILVTLHRRENRGHFADILWGINDAVPNGFVEWTAHPNGWAAQEAPNWAREWQRSPMPPDLFTAHLTNADLVVTDSGGCQEETNCLSVPCVVARTVTDRPESLGPKGGAILGGNTRESIYMAIQGALQMDRSQIDPTIFGDGKASERVVDWWQSILSGDTQ